MNKKMANDLYIELKIYKHFSKKEWYKSLNDDKKAGLDNDKEIIK